MNVETCQRIIDSSFALLTWCNGPGFSLYNLVQRSLAARPKSSLFNSFLFRPRLVAYHRGLFGLIHSIKNRRLTVFLTKIRICEVLGLWDFPGLFFLCLPLLFFFRRVCFGFGVVGVVGVGGDGGGGDGAAANGVMSCRLVLTNFLFCDLFFCGSGGACILLFVGATGGV